MWSHSSGLHVFNEKEIQFWDVSHSSLISAGWHLFGSLLSNHERHKTNFFQLYWSGKWHRKRWFLSTRQLRSPTVSSLSPFHRRKQPSVCVLMCYFGFPHTFLSDCLPFLSFSLSFCCHFFFIFSTSVNASYLWCTLGGFVTFWICVCVCEGVVGFTLRCLYDTTISWRCEVPKSDTLLYYCFNK